tara:strand:- start:312 stop:935 length:624 start_codon:yes stop_codon:yes gene_type:complete
MIPFYNLADQEIYNRGLSFIPQERFRLADPSFGSNLNATGIESIIDRNRAALNQAALNQASPTAFMMRGDQNNEDDIDRTNNLGITSLSDLTGFISTPGIIGGTIAGLPGAIIGRTLGQLFENIRDPYKDIFGRLNKQTLGAINRDQVRDLQARIDRGDFDGPTSNTGIPDRGRGNIGTRGGGGTSGSGSSSSAGFDQGERGGEFGR